MEKWRIRPGFRMRFDVISLAWVSMSSCSIFRLRREPSVASRLIPDGDLLGVLETGDVFEVEQVIRGNEESGEQIFLKVSKEGVAPGWAFGK